MGSLSMTAALISCNGFVIKILRLLVTQEQPSWHDGISSTGHARAGRPLGGAFKDEREGAARSQEQNKRHTSC